MEIHFFIREKIRLLQCRAVQTAYKLGWFLIRWIIFIVKDGTPAITSTQSIVQILAESWFVDTDDAKVAGFIVIHQHVAGDGVQNPRFIKVVTNQVEGSHKRSPPKDNFFEFIGVIAVAQAHNI